MESGSNRSRTRRQGERDHIAVRDRQPDQKRGQRHRGGQFRGLPEKPDTGRPLAGRGGGIGRGRRTNIRQGSGRHPGSPDGTAQDHVQPGSDGVRQYNSGAVQSGSSRRPCFIILKIASPRVCEDTICVRPPIFTSILSRLRLQKTKVISPTKSARITPRPLVGEKLEYKK